jgi:ribA/ribD-fused uncharacterized protein
VTVDLPVPPADEAHLYDPQVPPIGRFAGPWRPLSNFAPAVFDLDGLRFVTSEQAFNALKTLDPKQRAWVAAAKDAQQAKERGQKVTLQPRWDDVVRYTTMRRVLRAKFAAHPARVEFLLSTGMALLVEGNTWHDQHWGDCLCGRLACQRVGENHLGRALMRLRAELRDQGADASHASR